MDSIGRPGKWMFFFIFLVQTYWSFWKLLYGIVMCAWLVASSGCQFSIHKYLWLDHLVICSILIIRSEQCIGFRRFSSEMHSYLQKQNNPDSVVDCMLLTCTQQERNPRRAATTWPHLPARFISLINQSCTRWPVACVFDPAVYL